MASTAEQNGTSSSSAMHRQTPRRVVRDRAVVDHGSLPKQIT